MAVAPRPVTEKAPEPRATWLALALAALIALSTVLPHLGLAASAPPGLVASGLDTNYPDQASYLMWMNQHRSGVVLPTNRMTTEPCPRIAPNPTWLLLGAIAGLGGFDPIDVYHAGRVALAFLYLVALWGLSREVLHGTRAALLAFGTIALGGGLGWLADLGVPLGSSDWMPEMWSYPSLLHYPHFALSLLLVAAGLQRLIRARRTGRPADAWWAGLLFALLVSVHPYTAATLAVALTAEVLVSALLRALAPGASPRGPEAGASLRTLVPLATALGAFALHALTNPSMRQWARQNVMVSPPPLDYLAGLGLVGAVAAWGLSRALIRRELDATSRLLLAWIVAGFGLAYADDLLPFARRAVEGLHLAVALLAARALAPLLERIPRRRAALAIVLAWLVVLPTTLGHAVAEGHAANPGLVPRDWDALQRRVRDLAGDDGVYSDPRTSLYLAAFAGARVWLAHAQLTPGYDEKLEAQRRFFTGDGGWPLRARHVHEAGCTWLVTDISALDAWGPGSAGSGLVLHASGETWALYGPPR